MSRLLLFLVVIWGSMKQIFSLMHRRALGRLDDYFESLSSVEYDDLRKCETWKIIAQVSCLMGRNLQLRRLIIHDTIVHENFVHSSSVSVGVDAKEVDAQDVTPLPPPHIWYP